VGACESLYLAMQAFIDPGDEVILIEPFFDFYRLVCTMHSRSCGLFLYGIRSQLSVELTEHSAQIELAGGVVKSVPLRNRHLGKSVSSHVKTSADFELDWEVCLL
jgi:hypothetical protein